MLKDGVTRLRCVLHLAHLNIDISPSIYIGRKIYDTVNVDIFVCINFHEITTMGNFACIKIRVVSNTSSLWYYKSNFQGVHIYREYLRNELCAKISTRENIYGSQYIKQYHFFRSIVI